MNQWIEFATLVILASLAGWWLGPLAFILTLIVLLMLWVIASPDGAVW